MNFVRSDFVKLRHSLRFCAATLGVGTLLAIASFDVRQRAAAEKSTAQTLQSEFDLKLQRVRDEEAEIKIQAAVFRQLQAQGVLGEERRLEWVELLNEIRERRRLIGLHYEFSPRRRLDAEKDDAFVFYASAMRLRIELLHEEDLTQLIADFKQRASALIQIRSCDISRISLADDKAGAPRLTAECLIDWITCTKAPAANPLNVNRRKPVMSSIPAASPHHCAMHASRMLAIAVICALPPPSSEAASPAPEEPPLGRLFFTQEERQRLERQRTTPTHVRDAHSAAPSLWIQGIVSRSSGKHTLFIDGATQDEDEHIHGIAVTPDRHEPAQLSVRIENSPATRARVGDTVDRSSGAATPMLGTASIVQRATRQTPLP